METKKIPLNLLNIDSDVQTKEIEWLFYPFIPLGKITIIEGNPGIGKTWLCNKIVSEISKEKNQQELNVAFSNANCLYQSQEDSYEDTIKPRLEKLKAKLDNIYFIDETKYPLTMIESRISEAIKKTNAKLLVFDTIGSYIGNKIDINKSSDIKPILDKVSKIAAKFNIAIIIVRHNNKDTKHDDINRGQGSTSISGTARSIITVRYNKEAEKIVAEQIKSNVGPSHSKICYKIIDNNMIIIPNDEWDELDYTSQTDIQRCLNGMLYILNLYKSMDSTTIESILMNFGFSKYTIRKAKELGHISSKRVNNKWIWEEALHNN